MLQVVRTKNVIIYWELTEQICRYFVALTLARNTPRLFILNKALAFVIKDTLLLLRLLHYTFTTTETPLKLVKIILRFSSNALFH